MAPLYTENPILISKNLPSDDKYPNYIHHIPGLNLFVVFVNMELTYQDGLVMSRTSAESS